MSEEKEDEVFRAHMRSVQESNESLQEIPTQSRDDSSQTKCLPSASAQQHFRNFRYKPPSKPLEAASQLRELCRQWLMPETNSKEQILEVLVLEQFLNSLPQAMKNWVQKHHPQDVTQAAALVTCLQAQPDEVPSEDLGTFEDIDVLFSEEEWSMMNTSEKTLYSDVMLDIYKTATSLGLKPETAMENDQPELASISETEERPLKIRKKDAQEKEGGEETSDYEHGAEKWLEKRRQKNELQRICQDEASNMEHSDSDSEIEIVDIQPATREWPLGKTVQARTSSRLSTRRKISATTSKSTGSGQKCTTDSKNMLESMDMELEVLPETLLSDSQEEEGSPEQEGSSDEDEKKTLEEAKIFNPNEITVISSCSSDEDYCEIIEDSEDEKNDKTLETTVDQGQGHEKAAETASTISNTTTQHVHPEAVVEPTVRIDESASGVTEPRRSLQSQRPLLGERFAQLNTPQIRTQVYDLSITRSFQDTNTEEEDRKKKQCLYKLSQRIEMLRNLYDELQQTGQGQANQACQPREQMVTAIDDLGSGPIDSSGNDNSEHAQNQTDRLSEDPVDCTSPLLPHPSASSCEAMTVPHQPLTTAGYPPAESQYSSARPQDPPVQSDHASSDNLRENTQPGQDNSADSLTEENIINPHP